MTTVKGLSNKYGYVLGVPVTIISHPRWHHSSFYEITYHLKDCPRCTGVVLVGLLCLNAHVVCYGTLYIHVRYIMRYKMFVSFYITCFAYIRPVFVFCFFNAILCPSQASHCLYVVPDHAAYMLYHFVCMPCHVRLSISLCQNIHNVPICLHEYYTQCSRMGSAHNADNGISQFNFLYCTEPVLPSYNHNNPSWLNPV